MARHYGLNRRMELRLACFIPALSLTYFLILSEPLSFLLVQGEA